MQTGEPNDANDPNAEVLEFKGAKRTAVDDFEREYLVRIMTKTGGNLTTAASLTLTPAFAAVEALEDFAEDIQHPDAAALMDLLRSLRTTTAAQAGHTSVLTLFARANAA